MSLRLLRRKRSRKSSPLSSQATASQKSTSISFPKQQRRYPPGIQGPGASLEQAPGLSRSPYSAPNQDPLYNPSPQAYERPRRRRSAWPRCLLQGMIGLGLFWLILTLALVLPWGYLPLPTSSFMLQNAWQTRRPYSYRWTAYRNIPPEMALAVIAAEDQRFPNHNGFDFEEIGAALRDYQEGGNLRGASTISQQVAKNLYLWPGRSAIRKGMEVWFTAWIELLWSKERILTVYLNVAQMGDRTFGVGAASRQFFQVKPEDLTDAEAALLASSLPNPEVYRVDNPSNEMYGKQDWVLQQMHQLGGSDYLKELYKAPESETAVK